MIIVTVRRLSDFPKFIMCATQMSPEGRPPGSKIVLVDLH